MTSRTAIAKLMTANKITIRQLAAKIDRPMTRVRRIRNLGICPATCPADNLSNYALDWYEAITGSTEGFDSWAWCEE